jgi:hypothetical protein
MMEGKQQENRLENARSQWMVKVRILHSQNKVSQQLLGILENKRENDMVK